MLKQFTLWINRRLKKVGIIIGVIVFLALFGQPLRNFLSNNGNNKSFFSELVAFAGVFAGYIILVVGLVGLVGLVLYVLYALFRGRR
ncbi:MAG: hypothetical protein WCP97_04235 [bacterium]